MSNVTEISSAKSSPNSEKYICSLHPGPDTPVPDEFAALVLKLEEQLKMPVWLLIQNKKCDEDLTFLGEEVLELFHNEREAIAESKQVCLLLESAGGLADCAYKIGRIFQRRTTKFVVAIPSYAKSAATLLALGAHELILGRDAELGPLDVQMFDERSESFESALDAIQSLDRLNAFAMTAIDQTMALLTMRSLKRTEVLMPMVLNYVTTLLRPLTEKMDPIELTKKSRMLKVAEQYAIRLMRGRYSKEQAARIASALVENYPTHGFVIDRDEAGSNTDSKAGGLGLKLVSSDSIEMTLDLMLPYMEGIYMGRLRRAESDENQDVK